MTEKEMNELLELLVKLGEKNAQALKTNQQTNSEIMKTLEESVKTTSSLLGLVNDLTQRYFALNKFVNGAVAVLIVLVFKTEILNTASWISGELFQFYSQLFSSVSADTKWWLFVVAPLSVVGTLGLRWIDKRR